VATLNAGSAPVTKLATSAPRDSTPRQQDPAEIARLLQRGTDFLESGDIASARLLLRRPAEAGNAEAALALGSTYDPLVLQQLGVVGVAPDVALARQWYQKAADLGSGDARQRLANLAQTGQ
jgi:TPR repeat protein